jgi:hypothetical protein
LASAAREDTSGKMRERVKADMAFQTCLGAHSNQRSGTAAQ